MIYKLNILLSLIHITYKMQEYVEYIKNNYPLILNTVENYLNFGLSVDKIKNIFNDNVNNNNIMYPIDTNDLYFTQGDDYWLEHRIAQTFFNCPLVDEDPEILYFKFGASKYYDPNLNKITEVLNKMNFIEFLDDIGMRHEKSVEYNQQFNQNNNLKPEEFFFKLLFLMKKFYSDLYEFNKSHFNIDDTSNLIKWGRKNFRYLDYVDEYLIDYDFIKDQLLSDKNEHQISNELKDIYGIETYLTNILDGKHTGGLVGETLNNLAISPKEKALYYLNFKNNKSYKKKHSVVDLNDDCKMVIINHNK